MRVPEQVSVVGFDDIEGCEYFIPALTTVRQPFDELGRASLATLLDVVGGGSERHPAIPPTLVVRASTGPPPG
ncbi:hypothetical protein GCM10025865_06200 [Paraoerskovia sediminicola]|uniref:Transcriptional regulator LacI/GalR-like sensor domain-containing protein n=1 Tax=Paraoerskovia sediminicola TaxID=1138587 RepID=A0ABN6X962_9CELL|nr:hypothetical protein GCM10025865_06200 [Paraoerskovia sediminicola]